MQAPLADVYWLVNESGKLRPGWGWSGVELMTQSTRNSCHYSIYSVWGVVSVKIQCSIEIDLRLRI